MTLLFFRIFFQWHLKKSFLKKVDILRKMKKKYQSYWKMCNTSAVYQYEMFFLASVFHCPLRLELIHPGINSEIMTLSLHLLKIKCTLSLCGWPDLALASAVVCAVSLSCVVYYTGAFLICHKSSNLWRQYRLNRTYPPYAKYNLWKTKL